jgi:pseudouridine-5'-phosphate glycosidase
VIRVGRDVADALAGGRGVVALETTLVAHGFPPGEGVQVGLASEQSVREGGSTPATIGVLDGEIVVGLNEAELARFDASVGGLGGVHRGWPRPPDVSADLDALARTKALVVSSGVKSLLDVPATAELLETLGVPVLGWQTDVLPLFYSAHGGPPVSARVADAREAAGIAAAHWKLDGGGLLLGRPPDESLDDVEPLIMAALSEADRTGVHGQALTPFVLSYLHRESGGRTLLANRELIVGNARLAGEIAAAA